MKNIKKITDIPKNYPGIIEGTNEWYYVEEFANYCLESEGCVLYEAAEMYEKTGVYPGSCCHLIHYPDGVTHSPFKCSENVYVSNPVWDNGLYFLAVEFKNKRIIIYHYNDTERLLNIVAEFSCDDIDNYNLYLTASPVSLYSFSHYDGFEMIWPQKQVFEVAEYEWFDFRYGDDLYFCDSYSDENDAEHEIVIVRDISTGEVKEKYEGWAKRMPDGSMWRFESEKRI